MDSTEYQALLELAAWNEAEMMGTQKPRVDYFGAFKRERLARARAKELQQQLEREHTPEQLNAPATAGLAMLLVSALGETFREQHDKLEARVRALEEGRQP